MSWLKFIFNTILYTTLQLFLHNLLFVYFIVIYLEKNHRFNIK